jgi:YesN/AraC family two-component response regulator
LDYGDMKIIRTDLNRGAFDFLVKPIEFTDLEATIRKAFAHLNGCKKLQQGKAEAELAKATLSRHFSPSALFRPVWSQRYPAIQRKRDGLESGVRRRSCLPLRRARFSATQRMVTQSTPPPV